MLIYLFFFLIFSTGERPPDRHARLDLNVADPSVMALPLSGLQLTFKSTKKKKKKKNHPHTRSVILAARGGLPTLLYSSNG